MKVLFSIFCFLFSVHAFSRNLFSCTEKYSSDLILEQNANTWSIKGTAEKPNNPSKLKIQLYSDEAILLGNLGGEKLMKIGSGSYLERLLRAMSYGQFFMKKRRK